jgi:predicted DNA-binding protein
VSDNKVGRPALPEGEGRTATISVRVKPASKRRLRRTAALLRRTPSDVAREAFAIGMREIEKGLPRDFR